MTDVQIVSSMAGLFTSYFRHLKWILNKILYRSTPLNI